MHPRDGTNQLNSNLCIPTLRNLITKLSCSKLRTSLAKIKFKAHYSSGRFRASVSARNVHVLKSWIVKWEYNLSFVTIAKLFNCGVYRVLHSSVCKSTWTFSTVLCVGWFQYSFFFFVFSPFRFLILVFIGHCKYLSVVCALLYGLDSMFRLNNKLIVLFCVRWVWRRVLYFVTAYLVDWLYIVQIYVWSYGYIVYHISTVLYMYVWMDGLWGGVCLASMKMLLFR